MKFLKRKRKKGEKNKMVNKVKKQLKRQTLIQQGQRLGSSLKQFSEMRKMQPSLSYEQKIIEETMGGGRVNKHWGTGKDLPKLNGDLISGGGLINNGDIQKETARMFGF